MSEKEVTQFNVRVDRDLKRLIDADSRSNKEVAATALWREFGGARKAAIDMRIEHKDRRIEMIERELEDLQDELAEKKAEREALVAKREEMKTEDEQYRADVQELLDAAETGEIDRITPKLGAVEDVASGREESTEQVVEDARRIAAEQNRQLMNTDFMSPMEERKLRVDEVELIAKTYDGGEDDE